MATATTTAAAVETAPRPRRRRLNRFLAVAGALALLLAAWVAFDLYRPVSTSLREFDADEVARLETAMWRSYYSRERLRLFGQLAELLRTQYRLPFWRSNAVAYRAAKAAFVFKDGRSRADYGRAPSGSSPRGAGTRCSRRTSVRPTWRASTPRARWPPRGRG